jgi:hypothetical protein
VPAALAWAGDDGGGDGSDSAAAQQWRMVVSPFTRHWRPSEEHQPVWAIGLERQNADGSLVGASFFSNSFGQDCTYVYYGERTTGFWGQPKLFAQWSAGVIYGYRGKYEDKLPLNTKGFAPGALVSVGWNFDRSSSAALHLLGDAGVMLQLAYQFR